MQIHNNNKRVNGAPNNQWKRNILFVVTERTVVHEMMQDHSGVRGTGAKPGAETLLPWIWKDYEDQRDDLSPVRIGFEANLFRGSIKIHRMLKGTYY